MEHQSVCIFIQAQLSMAYELKAFLQSFEWRWLPRYWINRVNAAIGPQVNVCISCCPLCWKRWCTGLLKLQTTSPNQWGIPCIKGNLGNVRSTKCKPCCHRESKNQKNCKNLSMLLNGLQLCRQTLLCSPKQSKLTSCQQIVFHYISRKWKWRTWGQRRWAS